MVTLKVSNGIGSDSISKYILVQDEECEEHIYIPNAFSPNQNNLNEEFTVLNNLELPIAMSIYNRYGELIHETTSTSPAWDGTYRSTPCPIGVYVCVVRYTDIQGREHIKTSTFYLLDTD